MQLELADGFSLTNARICAAASGETYIARPTVQSEHAHVLIRDYGNAILVAFRGTRDPIDWRTDLEAWYSPVSSLFHGAPGHGCVHHGFWRAVNSIIEDLSKAMLHDWPSRPVVFTGHSLGGALAQLTASLMPSLSLPLGSRLHSVYTFGGPRVGDAAWRDHYDGLTLTAENKANEERGPRSSAPVVAVCLRGRTFRVVNQLDIVPRLPPLLAGYRHVGETVLLGRLGSMWVGPGWFRQLGADALSVWRDRHSRRLGVLLDHHISLYQQALSPP